MPGTNKWTSPTGPTPPLLWMVIVGLMFGGVVGAVAVADEDDEQSIAATEQQDDATDDGTASDADQLSDPADGASAGDADDPLSDPAALDKQPTTANNSAQVVPGGQAAKPAGEVAVTPAGSYKYSTSTSGDQNTNGDYTLVVEDKENGQQAHKRSGGGGDFSFTSTVAWTDDTMSTIGLSGGGESCPMKPPVVQLKRQLAIGTTWSSEGTCQSPSATTKISLEATVKETATVDLGGNKVAAWVVEFTQVVDVQSSFGSFTDRATGRFWLDPARGLELRREDTHDMTSTDAGGNTEKSRFTSTAVLTG